MDKEAYLKLIKEYESLSNLAWSKMLELEKLGYPEIDQHDYDYEFSKYMTDFDDDGITFCNERFHSVRLPISILWDENLQLVVDTEKARIEADKAFRARRAEESDRTEKLRQLNRLKQELGID